MKRTTQGNREIRQNRPGWRKKVVGHHKTFFYRRPVKIKGKEWEKVK